MVRWSLHLSEVGMLCTRVPHTCRTVVLYRAAQSRVTCVFSAATNSELLVSYMPLAYICKSRFDARATTRRRELSHVAFLTVAAERWLTWVHECGKGRTHLKT